eukprot:gene761-845_t
MTALKHDNVELKKRFDVLLQSIDSKDFSALAKIISSEKMRLKYICQVQRSLARDLFDLIGFVRKRLFLLLTPRANTCFSPEAEGLRSFSVQEVEELLGGDEDFLQQNINDVKAAKKKFIHNKLRHWYRDFSIWIRRHKNERMMVPLKMEEVHMSESGMRELLELDCWKANAVKKYVYREVDSLELLCVRLRNERLEALAAAEEMRRKALKAEERENALRVASSFKRVGQLNVVVDDASAPKRLSGRVPLKSRMPRSITNDLTEDVTSPILDRTVALAAENTSLKSQIEELKKFNKAMLARLNRERLDKGTDIDTSLLPEDPGKIAVARPPPVTAKPKRFPSVGRMNSVNYMSREESEKVIEQAVIGYKIEIAELQQNVAGLTKRCKEQEDMLVQLRAKITIVQGAKAAAEAVLDDVALEFKYLEHQNGLLQKAVADGYRVHREELEKERSSAMMLYQSSLEMSQSLPTLVVPRDEKSTQGLMPWHVANAQTDALLREPGKRADQADDIIDGSRDFMGTDRVLKARPRDIQVSVATAPMQGTEGHGEVDLNERSVVKSAARVKLDSYLKELHDQDALKDEGVEGGLVFETEKANGKRPKSSSSKRKAPRGEGLPVRLLGSDQRSRRTESGAQRRPETSGLGPTSKFRAMKNIPSGTEFDGNALGGSELSCRPLTASKSEGNRLGITESQENRRRNMEQNYATRLETNTAAYIQSKIVDPPVTAYSPPYEIIPPSETSNRLWPCIHITAPSGSKKRPGTALL